MNEYADDLVKKGVFDPTEAEEFKVSIDKVEGSADNVISKFEELTKNQDLFKPYTDSVTKLDTEIDELETELQDFGVSTQSL